MSATTAAATDTPLTRDDLKRLALRHLNDPEVNDWVQLEYLAWQMFSSRHKAEGILLELIEDGLVIMRISKYGNPLYSSMSVQRIAV